MITQLTSMFKNISPQNAIQESHLEVSMDVRQAAEVWTERAVLLHRLPAPSTARSDHHNQLTATQVE